MSKFLHLIREFHPDNNTDPVLKVHEFLASKGVECMIDGDMLVVNVNGERVRLSVITNEEEGESEIIDASSKDISDPNQRQALAVKKKTQQVVPKLIKKREDDLRNLQKSTLNTANIR